MRVLLDENLPHDLRHLLPGHDVATVAFQGWRGLENGSLLSAAATAGFDVLMSMDVGLGYEQSAADLPSPSSCSAPRATRWSRSAH